LAACQALVNPRFPLWGFWLMWYLEFKRVFPRLGRWGELR
jgi:hypothetical protein